MKSQICSLILVVAFVSSSIAQGIRPENNLAQGQGATLIPSLGTGSSQYANTIVDVPGTDKSIMFFCRNTKLSGVQRDRIWRTESKESSADWQHPAPVIQNEDSADTSAIDDLSCGPTVININHIWHMYYQVANRRMPVTMEVWHAISNDTYALHWTKLGRVDDLAREKFGGIVSSVSPVFADGKLYFYILGKRGQLFRMLSKDGYHFTNSETLKSPPSSTGRVTYSDGIYYFALGYDPSGTRQPPTHILLSYSRDGTLFEHCRDLTTAVLQKFPDLHYFQWPYFDPSRGLLYFSGSPEFPKRKAWESQGRIVVYADRTYLSPPSNSDCPRDTKEQSQ